MSFFYKSKELEELVKSYANQIIKWINNINNMFS